MMKLKCRMGNLGLNPSPRFDQTRSNFVDGEIISAAEPPGPR
jgi:hypothetical protein